MFGVKLDFVFDNSMCLKNFPTFDNWSDCIVFFELDDELQRDRVNGEGIAGAREPRFGRVRISIFCEIGGNGFADSLRKRVRA